MKPSFSRSAALSESGGSERFSSESGGSVQVRWRQVVYRLSVYIRWRGFLSRALAALALQRLQSTTAAHHMPQKSRSSKHIVSGRRVSAVPCKW